MHCSCCDRLLTDYEATRKDAHTFKFIDLCKNCFEEVKPFMSVIDRKDLITEQDLDVVEDDADLDTTEDWEDLSYFDAQFYRGFI